jgi:hypothetical protein
MARETAAQKLARQEAERAAAAADPPPPAPEPEKTGPVEAPYTLFGLDSLGDPAEFAWVPLGEVKAPTYQHAMELAKDKMRDRYVAAASDEAPLAPTLKLTVAAIASRNWNQGTAIVEMRPVTTWEK